MIGENNLSHRRKHVISDVVVFFFLKNQSTSKLNQLNVLKETCQ